jgi:hypothetical protein
MEAPRALVEAVRSAIVASAYQSTYLQLAAAAHACRRLGSLTSGRWRSVARDLAAFEEELQSAAARAAEDVARHAAALDIHDEALWTAGDAAATLDLLRERALEEVDEDSPAARIVNGEVVFGVSFLEDPDVPDRGTTLLFGWPEPLAPASWPWQANWIVAGNGQSDDLAEEELDLFETAEMEGEAALVDSLADELGCSEADARTALREAALALTRASLLVGEDDEDDDEDDEDDDAEDDEEDR